MKKRRKPARPGMVRAPVTTMLAEWMKQSPEAVKPAMRSMLHYAGELRHAARAANPPLRRAIAHSVHLEIDQAIERQHACMPQDTSQISCRRGCSHCCHLYVGISAPEAELLREVVAQEGPPVDEARLERQARHTEDSWEQLTREDRRCVFLQADDSCGVYEFRPAACRKYHVVSDPAMCDVDANKGAQVAVYVFAEAEMIASSAGGVFPADNMARQLLKARGK